MPASARMPAFCFVRAVSRTARNAGSRITPGADKSWCIASMLPKRCVRMLLSIPAPYAWRGPERSGSPLPSAFPACGGYSFPTHSPVPGDFAVALAGCPFRALLAQHQVRSPALIRVASGPKNKNPATKGRGGVACGDGRVGSEGLTRSPLTLPHPAAGPGAAAVAACRSSPSAPWACLGAQPSFLPRRLA